MTTYVYEYKGGGQMCDVGGPSQEPMPTVPVERDKWSQRTINMRCRTCMFWVRKDDDRLKLLTDSEALGRCRRHAPTLAGWPVMYAIDWCGDHKLDGGKL